MWWLDPGKELLQAVRLVFKSLQTIHQSMCDNWSPSDWFFMLRNAYWALNGSERRCWRGRPALLIDLQQGHGPLFGEFRYESSKLWYCIRYATNRVTATVIRRLLMHVLLWTGSLTLRNLRLKREALDKFRLPVNVVEGTSCPVISNHLSRLMSCYW